MNPTRHAPLGLPAVGRASSGPDKRHSQPALHGLAVAIPQLASWPPLRARQVAIHVYWMEAVEPIRRACATQGPHLFVGSGHRGLSAFWGRTASDILGSGSQPVSQRPKLSLRALRLRVNGDHARLIHNK